MQLFQDISIKSKLMVLTMVSVVAAMTLSCAVFIIQDFHNARNEEAESLLALADVLGVNASAALSFQDQDAAEQLLRSLAVLPSVTSAVMYDMTGNVFASYPAEYAEQVQDPMPQQAGYHCSLSELHAASTIVENDELLGAIRVNGDLSLVWQQMVHFVFIVIPVMLVSCCAAYVLASYLQHKISRPILDLTQAAQTISEANDYSIRVTPMGNDELGALCGGFNSMLEQIEASRQALEEAHNELEHRVEERTSDLSKANEELSRENAERVRAEKQLEAVHREFMESARRAGMAEIATGVLHNVGNVLNSVNVSVVTLFEHLKGSKVKQLTKVIDLLKQQEDHLGDFLTNDEKGKQVPQFLKVLAERLEEENQTLVEETRSLTSNIEHIKTIVATQQSYAKSGGMVDAIDINSLLDDAVRLNATSFNRHQIEVVRDFETLPPVMIDKQRVLQIVINLVKNAKESLGELDQGKKVLTLRTRIDGQRLIVQVCDTGVGIEAENLNRIFTHGFTTKQTGHGFGLHSCANSATEMDGTLTVCSDGPMQGATFTLKLPLRLATAPLPESVSC